MAKGQDERGLAMASYATGTRLSSLQKHTLLTGLEGGKLCDLLLQHGKCGIMCSLQPIASHHDAPGKGEEAVLLRTPAMNRLCAYPRHPAENG
jgi:hypothetical protein